MLVDSFEVFFITLLLICSLSMVCMHYLLCPLRAGKEATSGSDGNWASEAGIDSGWAAQAGGDSAGWNV